MNSSPLALALGPTELQRILLILFFAGSVARAATAEEFPARVSSADVPRLMRSTAFVRELSEDALRRMVPVQSGLRYVDCPNCQAGRQENQLEWDPEHPDEVHCRYCEHRYPSQQYPMNQAVTVRNPRGETVTFPYWADEKGYRHFFQARRDDEVRQYLAEKARQLAQLYVATGDRAHARRSAVLLDQFAQVFPGWCYHFDYPFQQKEIYDGDVSPSQFRPGYRTARWTWWAYSDIPLPLVDAYDWIRDSGVFSQLSDELKVDTAQRIERDLFRNAADQVLANPEPHTNMSPTAWRGLVHMGRVIREPAYVHETVRRLRHLVERQFFYDGAWAEGSPDYASQTVGGLENVLEALRGYSDPEGYSDPVDGQHFVNLDLEADFPALRQARQTLRLMRLPNGRSVPVHDTWSTSQRGAVSVTKPWLLPALGHACLGGGEDAQQTQFHLTWSGGYGHSHADNLSLLLFSSGHEQLSDLGYTHTAWRSWTLASVAHNTVVIDGKNQSLGGRSNPSDGRLLFCDLNSPRVQMVKADGRRGYSGTADVFERTLMVIDAGAGRWYAVDRFEVSGGKIQDYFLHGNADVPGRVSAPLEFRDRPALLRSGQSWKPTMNEGEAGRISEQHYAYGFLRDLRTAEVSRHQVVPVEFTTDASGPPNGSVSAASGVRAWLVPEDDGELVLGRNPAIRPAKENDAELDRWHRPFLMLRRRANAAPGVFMTVIEPWQQSPFVTEVEPVVVDEQLIGVRVTMNDRSDLVLFECHQPVTISAGAHAAQFSGQAGWLRLRDDMVEHASSIGQGGWTRNDFQLTSAPPGRADLRAIEGDELILGEGTTDPPRPGDVVRIITADDWVYPLTVAEVIEREGTLRVKVRESLAFAFQADAGKLRLLAFPQREHTGMVSVEWLSAAHGAAAGAAR